MENQNKLKSGFLDLFRKNKGDAQTEGRPWSAASIAKKLLLVIASVLCAMLFWGYVLMAQNPNRTKSYADIPVRLESGSESDLLSKNLMVYGEISEMLKNVTVTVQAPLTDITKITAKDITATVSFNDVHASGISRLEVHATCANNGTVVEVDPAYLEVDIDNITSRNIAVDQEFTGQLQPGYWHGTATVSPKTVTVKGARRDIESISSAVCVIDLSELTESVNHSFTLKLTDDEGNEFDQLVLQESIPAVNVQMQVMPYKEVEIKYAYGDHLRNGLAISEETLSIPTVNIASDSNALAKLEYLMADTVYLSNIDSPGVYEFSLGISGVPDEAVIVDYPNLRSVKLTIVVEDTITERTLEGITLNVAGKSGDYTYSYYLYDENGELGEPLVRLAMDVTVIGDINAVEAITAADIMLLIDVTGLGPGEHDVPVRLIWNDAFGTLNGVEYGKLIHVVIERTGE